MIAIMSAVALLSAVFPTEEATTSGAVDFTWMFVKMLGLLGFVSVLAVMILKFAVPHVGLIKKFQRDGNIKILERSHLDPKKSIYLISAFKRYFVIGASDHAINLIAEIDPKSIDETNDGASNG